MIELTLPHARSYFILLSLAIAFCSCSSGPAATQVAPDDSVTILKPVFVSESVQYDSDDPAIWIDHNDPSQSLVIGTDKGGDTGDGALYVFDLAGKEIPAKRLKNVKRPNNVDVAYGMVFGDSVVDIAVCTERNTNSIRVVSLPDMRVIDGGGIPVFEGENFRLPMGIALYKRPDDGRIYAIVSRKSGPTDGTYLWEYILENNGNGAISGKVVRKFGQYSGKNEIESVAVDSELGYVYYSDEGVGIRKYYAHPDSSGVELALFGTMGFADNHEGISIYKFNDKTGYILVSDQQAQKFHVFPREGTAENPNEHPLIKTLKLSTFESDGSDVTSVNVPAFPHGFFVAMSDDKTFQFYRWEDIAGTDLKIAK